MADQLTNGIVARFPGRFSRKRANPVKGAVPLQEGALRRGSSVGPGSCAVTTLRLAARRRIPFSQRRVALDAGTEVVAGSWRQFPPSWRRYPEAPFP
jgi:hypothetical protein